MLTTTRALLRASSAADIVRASSAQVGHLVGRLGLGGEPFEVLETAQHEALEPLIAAADDLDHLLLLDLGHFILEQSDRGHVIQRRPDLVADEGEEVVLQLIEDAEPYASLLEMTGPGAGDLLQLLPPPLVLQRDRGSGCDVAPQLVEHLLGERGRVPGFPRQQQADDVIV